jgi:AraC-like DNA-binding protein
MKGQRKVAPIPEGAVHIWHEGILFLGTGIRNAPHRHFTASLSFALDQPFAFREGRKPWRLLRGIAVAPNVQQQMDCRGNAVAILQIDPETEAYGRAARLFAQHGAVVELADETVDHLAAAARGMQDRADFDPSLLWGEVLDRVAGNWLMPQAPDPRVARVREILKRELPGAPSVADLAKAVGLSAGRLIHLWNDELGTSLRRYILWLRLRHVVFCVGIGRNLTEAAHEAGFADSAHLSRTFHSMFGLPLSRLFGGAARVRLFFKFPEAELAGPHGPTDRERWATAAKVLRRRA